MFKGEEKKASTAYARRKPGRPPGAKNIPKALTIEMAQALAMKGVQLRSTIDTGRHLRRLAEMATEVGDRHASGEYLSPDEGKSIKVELDVLTKLLKLTLPDVAMVRSETPITENEVLQGVVVLPQLDSLTTDQRTKPGKGAANGQVIPGTPGNGAK
jgi:hypothetical protein